MFHVRTEGSCAFPLIVQTYNIKTVLKRKSAVLVQGHYTSILGVLFIKIRTTYRQLNIFICINGKSELKTKECSINRHHN